MISSGDRQRPWKTVWLVYRREIDARLSSKGYFISMAVMAVLVFGLVLGLYWANAPRTYDVALCGVPATAVEPVPSQVVTRPCPDLAAARARTDAKDVEAAVAVHDGRVSVVVRSDTRQPAREAALAMARNWATAMAYQRQHVDIAQLTQTVAQLGPDVVTVGKAMPSSTEVGAAISLVIVLFMQIVGQGSLVAQGVVEEKSSRIVEVLLPAVTPIRLMIGKVAGIGTAALLQIAVLVGAIFAARALTDDQPGAMPGAPALISGLAWFLLSFALYACLFAAAGSLVSRPEDLQSVLMPVMVLAMVPIGVAAAAAGAPSAAWVGVLQYIPPFSGLLMPLQAGVGGVTLGQQLIAAAVMLAVTIVCMRFAARVYSNSILKIGGTVRWREALMA